MATAAKLRLASEDLKPNIGSRVLNSKAELLSGELASEIRALLEARGVLVFPQVHLTDAEQVAFTKTLGNFAPEGDYGETVHNITLDPKLTSAAEYLKGSLYWHLDGVRNSVPILASLLSCRVPSPKGTGNTGFANTYAAYEALSDEDKARFEDMRVMHGTWATLFYHEPEPSLAQLEGYMRTGEANLPLVWKHRSGRKSLILGCTASRVVGLDALESAKVLHGLRDFATSDEFTYSHEWEVGDCVMWDNTGTLHRAEKYDPATGRLMVRTKLEGEEPFE